MSEDFWDWLLKAYGEVGDETVFTKYNMEVAFAAGAEAEAKRMWVGLTDEELRGAIKTVDGYEQYIHPALRQLARAIEAKLKEKNT